MRLPTAIAGCWLAGLCLSSPTQGQQQTTEEFQLAICNMSSFSRVLVAVAHRQDAQRWAVAGWYPVPDGGCAITDTFKGNSVYYYAFGETRDGNLVFWEAAENDKTASAQCVDHNKFFRLTAGVPNCATGQDLARFRPIRATPNQLRTTFTLTGRLRRRVLAAALFLPGRCSNQFRFGPLAGPRRQGNYLVRFGRDPQLLKDVADAGVRRRLGGLARCKRRLVLDGVGRDIVRLSIGGCGNGQTDQYRGKGFEGHSCAL